MDEKSLQLVKVMREQLGETSASRTVDAVAFSAVFATAFAFSAWQRSVSRIGANRVLVYQYLISPTGVASGVVFFGEVLGPEKIVGGAVTLAGVYLARRQ